MKRKSKRSKSCMIMLKSRRVRKENEKAKNALLLEEMNKENVWKKKKNTKDKNEKWKGKTKKKRTD